MLGFVRSMTTNVGVAGEMLTFLWRRKLWWMMPLVAVLLIMAILLVFASSSGIGPFIYALF